MMELRTSVNSIQIKRLFSGLTSEPPSPRKWRGLVKATLAASVAKVWEVISDFSGVYKWDDDLISSDIVSGQNYKVGCVRSIKYKLDGKVGNCTERLLHIDPHQHIIEWTVESPNPWNWSNFKCTMRVTEDKRGNYSLVEWAFELDPLSQVPEEVLVNKLSSVYSIRLLGVEDLAL